jgi:DNA-binding SARP family transcriptional activator
LLIEIHAREGNVRDAVLAYRRFQQILDQDLGLSPSPELVSLIASVAPPRTPPIRRGSGPRRTAAE